MRRFTGFLAALLLALLTLGVYPGRVLARAGHDARAGAPAQNGRRLRHPHFAHVHQVLHLVAAPTHRPAPRFHTSPPVPIVRRFDDVDGLLSLGDVDTDTDDGVFAAASWRYRLAADTRELDLPLGVDARPQAPVAWPRSPRGPPVA